MRMMEGEVIAAESETHCRDIAEAELEAGNGDTQIFISYDNQSGKCIYSSNFNIKLEESENSIFYIISNRTENARDLSNDQTVDFSSIIIYSSISVLLVLILILVTIFVRQLRRTRTELSTVVMENDLYGVYEENSTTIKDYNAYYQQQDDQ